MTGSSRIYTTKMFTDTALVSKSSFCHYHVNTCAVMSYSLETVPDDVIYGRNIEISNE